MYTQNNQKLYCAIDLYLESYPLLFMIYQPFFGFNRKRNMWNQKGSKNTNKDVGVVTIISLLLLRYLESYINIIIIFFYDPSLVAIEK